MLLQVLDNHEGPARDIVLLNAGAALYAAGVAASITDGVAKARIAIASGAARARLDQYVAVTQRLAGR
jgi:anthranilate phosphoribosyltransferase